MNSIYQYRLNGADVPSGEHRSPEDIIKELCAKAGATPLGYKPSPDGEAWLFITDIDLSAFLPPYIIPDAPPSKRDEVRPGDSGAPARLLDVHMVAHREGDDDCNEDCRDPEHYCFIFTGRSEMWIQKELLTDLVRRICKEEIQNDKQSVPVPAPGPNPTPR